MIKAYSIDLREKVIQFIQSGKTQIEAAKTFNIHKSTINHWLSRLRKEGSLKARANLGSKSKINIDELIRCITNNPNLRLIDLKKIFEISIVSLHKWLKKLGFVYKKKPLPTWKQMKIKDKNI
jgi:transposase